MMHTEGARAPLGPDGRTFPLSGARVFLSGSFSVSKGELAMLLERNGATARGKEGGGLLGLSRKTCVIVRGDEPPERDNARAERLAFDGFRIPVITEAELRGVLAGVDARRFPCPRKHIDITLGFVFHPRFSPVAHLDFRTHTHFLGKREIFIHGAGRETAPLQACLGNIGAYTSDVFSPSTTDFCWLTEETLRGLRRGRGDEFTRIIEDGYNSSAGARFNCRFLIASEVVAWLERRAREVGDALSLGYITRYRDSLRGAR